MDGALPGSSDRKPSLSIRDAVDGKVLVRCHAGCDQERVISALQSRGLWPENGTHPSERFAARANVTSHPERDEARRTEGRTCHLAGDDAGDGTSVETYLAGRGSQLTPSPSLRFHAGLKHPSGSVWPAMVALVTRGVDDAPLAIHRTFLARDGSARRRSIRRR